MAYFIYNNKKVYYKVTGEGEPLMLLHGNSVSSKLFISVIKLYKRDYKLILIDFPGHGKSERVDRFETDFWFYNSEVCMALLDELKIDKVNVVGTSGGALVGINMALEYPDRVNFLIADSFEGEYPLPSFTDTIEVDRERDKKKFAARIFWFMCHGFGWRKVVDLDTEVNIEFAKLGRSFFHKPISELKVPTILTGSKKDEYCDHLESIYNGLQKKNDDLNIHMFDSGGHPAMLSNKTEFFDIVKSNVKSIH